jgi:hypothetical protein
MFIFFSFRILLLGGDLTDRGVICQSFVGILDPRFFSFGREKFDSALAATRVVKPTS